MLQRRSSLLIAVAGGISIAGASAHGQPYYQRTYDPCRPAPVYAGALGALANAISQPQRNRDCLAKRQAQWADYNARIKAAQERVAEAAAAQRQAQLEAQAAQELARAEQAKAERKAEVVAAARRAREAKIEAQRQAQQAADEAEAQRVADAARRARYVALISAEKSPDNFCRKQEMARAVIEGWNGLDTFKDEGLKVIDIEHLTTSTYDADAQVYSCHGVFMTNKGWNVLGTITLKKNVAGDPMVSWVKDDDQDLTRYTPPPALDATSPEVSAQTKVTTREAVSPVTTPEADKPSRL